MGSQQWLFVWCNIDWARLFYDGKFARSSNSEFSSVECNREWVWSVLYAEEYDITDYLIGLW